MASGNVQRIYFLQIAWLEDSIDPLLARVSRRVSFVTGLSTESAEQFQVANYGLGGHYGPHPDYSELSSAKGGILEEKGDRTATMLMYLDDVDAGGATAFTQLGFAVRPRRGTAVFWYNLTPYNGPTTNYTFWGVRRHGDNRTYHAGCPVLRGSKWIATKWIHELYNTFPRFDLPG